MRNALQEVKGSFSKEDVEVIKNTVAKGATDTELKMFLYISRKYGLDPFLKEIWFYKRPNRNGSYDTVIQTSRDGLLSVAMRDPNYRGLIGGVVREGDIFEFNADEGTVKHKFGVKRGRIIGAWATAYHAKRMPVSCFVDFEEYRQETPSWKKYPSAMIQKVAEAFVLRRQFDIHGLYTPEEMRMNDVQGENITADVQPQYQTDNKETGDHPNDEEMPEDEEEEFLDEDEIEDANEKGEQEKAHDLLIKLEESMLEEAQKDKNEAECDEMSKGEEETRGGENEAERVGQEMDAFFNEIEEANRKNEKLISKLKEAEEAGVHNQSSSVKTIGGKVFVKEIIEVETKGSEIITTAVVVGPKGASTVFAKGVSAERLANLVGKEAYIDLTLQSMIYKGRKVLPVEKVTYSSKLALVKTKVLVKDDAVYFASKNGSVEVLSYDSKTDLELQRLNGRMVEARIGSVDGKFAVDSVKEITEEKAVGAAS